MEQESSVISTDSTNSTAHDSGSNGNSLHYHDQFQRHNQTGRNEANVATSRFKGVVGQPNGHWGAQIYVNHQRIWLGTFKSEKEAAMAYDSAAIKLRNGDSHRNFPLTSVSGQEPHFQSQFSTEAVLNMIKDGSYPSKYADFLRVQFQDVGNLSSPHSNAAGLTSKELFQKELTPSDVGKLNRLVIPKKFAVKYFPRIYDDLERNDGVRGVQDTDLDFIDRSMRTWKFRYCYWKSSQSFVFTRGWSQFVKEKGVRANDVVMFSRFEDRNGANDARNLFMIDVKYSNVASSDAVEDAYELEMRLGVPDSSCHNAGKGSSSETDSKQDTNAYAQAENFLGDHESSEEKKGGFRLFGVQIS